DRPHRAGRGRAGTAGRRGRRARSVGCRRGRLAAGGDPGRPRRDGGGRRSRLGQPAVAAGATVVAAARGARTAALAGLGADLVVDYGDPAWAERVREIGGGPLVYDGVGGDVGRTALELLRPGGRLVMFGFSSGSPTQLTTA